MRAREDRRSGLPAQLLDREPRVVARAQKRLALLDERAHERPQLVQRRAPPLDVLLERERELGAVLELAPEHDERPEREPAEQRIQMGTHARARLPLRPVGSLPPPSERHARNVT